MTNRKEIGRIGEKIAIELLEKDAYVVLEQNWHFGPNEIDIIAQKQDILCIVEVKTRQSKLSSPSQEITLNQQKRIIKSAEAYLTQKNIELEVRFDVFEIWLNTSNPTINWIKDAFYPALN